MGWPGRIDPDRHISQIKLAWKDGIAVHGATNTRVVFNGTLNRLWSYEGHSRFLTGRMDFWHYDAKILAVDFDNDRITDFGWSQHSPTTTLNIRCWTDALMKASIHGMLSLRCPPWPFDWTRTVNNKLRGAGWHEDMWQRFRAGVPWVQEVEGEWWYYGPGWSQMLVRRYDDLHVEALNGAHNEHPAHGYRWFMCDWDINGVWSKHFISDDAERRWKKRHGKTP